MEFEPEEPPQIEKISLDQNFISYRLLEQIISHTNIPKIIIEEKLSELWYETISGKGQIDFQNKVTFVGAVDKGVLESQESEITFADGVKYKGEVHNNRLTGYGEYTFPSGATYKGAVFNGQRNGYGVFVSPDGVTYEGYWLNGLKHGQGKMRRPLLTYDGEWENGDMCGKGKLNWDNGNVYQGEFENNLIHGDGYLIWNDINEKYLGEWRNNKQCGFGSHLWYEPKGELKVMRNRYVGEWVDGVREGYGVFFYSDGGYFEGVWENNYKEGFGIFTFLDGKKYIGRFEKDRLIDEKEVITEEMIDEHFEKIEKMKEKELEKEKSESTNRNESSSVTFADDAHSKHSTKISLSPRKRLKLPVLKGKPHRKNLPGAEVTMDVIEETEKDQNRSRNNIGGTDLSHTNRSRSKVDLKIPRPLSKGRNISLIKNPKAGKGNSEKTLSGSILSDNQKTSSEKEEDKNSKKKIFLPYINISDLYLMDPNIEKDIKEVQLTLMRWLTEIKRLYVSIQRNIERENDDQQTFVSSSKNLPTESLNTGKRERKLSRVGNIQTTSQHAWIPEATNSNDFNFSLQLKDIWKYLRDSGLINMNFTLCDFDRIFYHSQDNDIEFFSIPEEIKEDSLIYNYMKEQIYQAKKNFIYKNKKYIKYFYSLNEKKKPECLNISVDDKIKHFTIDKSIHNKSNPILPRMIFEILVRVAFCKYNTLGDKVKLSQKLKNLIAVIITPRIKKNRTGNRSSLSRLEQSFNSQQQLQESRAKAQEKSMMEEFFRSFETELNQIFNVIYLSTVFFPSQRDRTITHKHFYEKFIMRSKMLRKIVRTKSEYAAIITYFYKDKGVMANLEKSHQHFLRIEELFETDFNKYEFVEILYLIYRKHITEKAIIIPERRNSVSSNIIQALKDLLNAPKKESTRQVYFYPKLKKHTQKETMMEELKKKLMEEEKHKVEVQRFTIERKRMNDEDNNCYKEEEDLEDEEDDDDYY